MKDKIQRKYGHMVINGKYYIIDSIRGRPTLIPVSKTEIDKKLKKAKQIAKKLKGDLDAEKVIVESLMIKFDKEDLDKLHNQLFKSKRKYKARTREHHCVDMKVGNTIIPIVD